MAPFQINADLCRSEWKQLREVLQRQQELRSDGRMQDLSQFLLRDTNQDLFPEMCKLIVRACVLPMSTADCERGFSCMNRIVTAQRNRLKTVTIDYLIRVSVQGPPIEQFNFDHAIDKWVLIVYKFSMYAHYVVSVICVQILIDFLSGCYQNLSYTLKCSNCKLDSILLTCTRV